MYLCTYLLFLITETTTTTTTSTTSSTTISTTSTPTIIPASLSTFDKTNSSNFTNYSKSKVTVNSPAQSPDDNNDDLCSDCQCRCGASDNSKLSENSNLDSTESALFPTLGLYSFFSHTDILFYSLACFYFPIYIGYFSFSFEKKVLSKPRF